MIKKDLFCFVLKFLYTQSGMFSKNLWVTLKNNPLTLLHFKSRLPRIFIFSLSSFLFVEGENKYPWLMWTFILILKMLTFSRLDLLILLNGSSGKLLASFRTCLCRCILGKIGTFWLFGFTCIRKITCTGLWFSLTCVKILLQSENNLGTRVCRTLKEPTW